MAWRPQPPLRRASTGPKRAIDEFSIKHANLSEIDEVGMCPAGFELEYTLAVAYEGTAVDEKVGTKGELVEWITQELKEAERWKESVTLAISKIDSDSNHPIFQRNGKQNKVQPAAAPVDNP